MWWPVAQALLRLAFDEENACTRLVYFKHKEIFLVVCIVTQMEVRCYLCPLTSLALSGPLLHGL